MSENKKTIFDKFSPKTNYFLGLGSGIVGLLVIGFFVLLGLLLSDNGIGKLSGSTDKVQPTAAAPSPSPNQPTAVDTDFEITQDDHVKGDFNAPITVVEFSDFQCPYCSRFHPTLQKLLDDYPGQVRWVYKHFPLTSIHPQAQSAAEAAECAYDQGGDNVFWAYGDALFENQDRLGKSLFLELAGNQGLNTDTFEDCLDSSKFRQKVLDDYQEGVAAGVRGTPGSFINGQSVPGAVPYEQVQSIVDSLL